MSLENGCKRKCFLHAIPDLQQALHLYSNLRLVKLRSHGNYLQGMPEDHGAA